MKNKEFITLHLTLRLRPRIYHRLVSLSYRGQLPLHKIVGWWIKMMTDDLKGKKLKKRDTDQARRQQHVDN